MFNSECQIEGNGYTEYTDLNGYPRKSLKYPFQSAASVYSVYLFHPVSPSQQRLLQVTLRLVIRNVLGQRTNQ